MEHASLKWSLLKLLSKTSTCSPSFVITCKYIFSVLDVEGLVFSRFQFNLNYLSINIANMSGYVLWFLAC